MRDSAERKMRSPYSASGEVQSAALGVVAFITDYVGAMEEGGVEFVLFRDALLAAQKAAGAIAITAGPCAIKLNELRHGIEKLPTGKRKRQLDEWLKAEVAAALRAAHLAGGWSRC